MNSKAELIEMPNSGEVYGQLNGEDNKLTNKKKQKFKFCLKSITETLVFILIATLIVVLLALGWSLLLLSQPYRINQDLTKQDENHDKPKIENGHCGLNWTAYKDEKCFQILNGPFQTFDEAVESCAKLEKGATLPVIQSREEQVFLSNYLFIVSRKVENFWIGAKVGQNNTFHWIDDSDLAFTNWVTKGPRIRDDYCAQMQADEEFLGKWIDEHCQEKNFVVCQKVQSWSVERLQKIVITARKYYDDLLEKANNKIIEQARALKEVDQKIDIIKQNIVPIGFVYAQLPNETSPQEMWPWMVWTDVSSTYAGVFFRVNGGDAAAFGQVQPQNASTLAEVYVGDADNLKTGKAIYGNDKIAIPSSGWSDGIYTGTYEYTQKALYTHFKLSTGENRPRNMAIRIWKRTG